MSDLRPSSEPRSLGKSGISVSPLAWGMWRFAGNDVAAAQAKVEAALAAGITLFDTADVYGPDNGEPFGAAESLLGRVLAQASGLADRMVIATKGGIIPGIPYDSSAEYLERALDVSLRRMRVDQVALYQIHRPDLLAHPEEVAAALARMVESGKAAAIGVSNHSARQVGALQSYLPFAIASQQPEFSPLATAPLFDGVFDQALKHGMAVLAWSPLGGGRIAKPADPRAAAVAALLDAKAEALGVDRAAAAYAWIMVHPLRPIPIVGTQDPARIAAAANALKVSWSRAEWYRVLEAGMGERLP